MRNGVLRRAVVVVLASVMLALGGVGSASASGGSSINGVSETTVRKANTERAVVYAATYAQARKDGLSKEAALDAAEEATRGVADAIPQYSVDGKPASYQAGYNPTRRYVYMDLQPGFWWDPATGSTTQDDGYTYCVRIDLRKLNDGYVSKAVGRLHADKTISTAPGCLPKR